MSDLRAEFVALASQPGANRRALCQRFEISAATSGCGATPSKVRRGFAAATAQSAADGPGHLLAARSTPPGGRASSGAAGPPGRPAPASRLHHHGDLRRHDRLIPRRGPARRAWHFEHPYPNALWQMDFKGGWPCGPGRCQDPRRHSRYALGLAACPNQRTATVDPPGDRLSRYGSRPPAGRGSPWGNRLFTLSPQTLGERQIPPSRGGNR